MKITDTFNFSVTNFNLVTYKYRGNKSSLKSGQIKDLQMHQQSHHI